MPPLGNYWRCCLSPLHPVRLAWSAVLATVARMATTDPNLLGIAEAWSFPNSGLGVFLLARDCRCLRCRPILA